MPFAKTAKVRSKRRASALRNLLAVGALVALMGGAVLFAASLNRTPEPILDEDPAIDLARRKSPDNAYAILAQAAAELKPPKGMPPGSDEHEFWTARWTANAETPARLLDMAGQEATKESIEYFGVIQSAMEKALPALDKPYFLLPEVPIERPWERPPSRFIPFTRAIVALGAWQARAQDKFDEGLRTLVNAIRISRMAGQDRGTLPEEPGAEGQALAQLRQIARDASDPARLDKMQGMLDALGPPYPSRKPVFMQYWRAVDEILLHPRTNTSLNPGERIAVKLALWNVQSRADWMRANRDKLLGMAEQKPTVIFNAIEKSGLRFGDTERRWGAAHMLWHLVRNTQAVNAQYQGTRIAVAIERYQRAHGAYPEDLAALVPAQLSEIPPDPWASAPFAYKRGDNAYTLYSLGEDGRDGEGDPRSDSLLVGKPAERTGKISVAN